MQSWPLVEPAYLSAPQYHKTLGPEVADLCAAADYEPDPEQCLGLDLLFGLDRSNRSVAFEFAVVCSRQNLKTGLLKQASLGWLFVTREQLVVWSAHEYAASMEALRDLKALIETHPFLSRRVAKIYEGSGNEHILMRSGARLLFKARTTSSGRSLSADKVVLDEAFALKATHVGSLFPTLRVRPDPQLAYGSSAGKADSEILRGLRDRGRAGNSPRLAYMEWCAPPGGCEQDRCEHQVGTPGCALDKVENLKASNPLLGRVRPNGTGLTLQELRDEREAMAATPQEYAREALGWWDEAGAAEIFGAGKWESCAGGLPESPMGALAVAVAEDLSSSAVGAAAMVGGRVLVKPLRHGPKIDWIVEAVRELHAAHAVPVIVDGRGPAASLIPRLRRIRGIQLYIASSGEVLDAFAQLFVLVTEGRLLHGAFPELDASINGATTKNVGDRKSLARRTSTSDLSPAESVMLAAWWVSRPPGGSARRPTPELAAAKGRRNELETVGF